MATPGSLISLLCTAVALSSVQLPVLGALPTAPHAPGAPEYTLAATARHERWGRFCLGPQPSTSALRAAHADALAELAELPFEFWGLHINVLDTF